jgi:hypothetical protein
MNSNLLLEELRKFYREGKFQDLRNRYALCSWMLTPVEREKIETALEHVLPKKSIPGKQTSLLEQAQEIMGGEITKI